MPIDVIRLGRMALALGCLALQGCYLTHVAGGQLHVLTSTISLEEALQDPSLSAVDKAKLREIQAVKSFAENELALKRTSNYSSYLPPETPGKHEPLNWVVTAARKDSLTPVTWWYPIVGTASYKGFFDEGMASDEAKDLEAKGFETYVWPAGAYSTLGWFSDPIIPTMLDQDEASLTMLIIHELTHATLLVPDETEFNESLAEFVSHRGAMEYLDRKYGPGNPHTAALRRYLATEDDIDEAVQRLADRLKALYASDAVDIELRRGILFNQARREMAGICKAHGVTDSLCLPNAPLNNAVVLSRITYGSPAPFETLFERCGESWYVFFHVLHETYEKKDDWYPPP